MLPAIFLLITIIALTYVVYRIFDQDLFTPPSLLCCVFLVVISAAIYNSIHWHLNLGMQSVLILVSGILTFVVVSYLVFLVHRAFLVRPNILISERRKNLSLRPISINMWMLGFTCIFGSVISVVYILCLLRAARSIPNADLSSWNNMMNSYRTYTAYHQDLSEASIPSIVTYANYVFTAFSYVYMFVFLNNWVMQDHSALLTLPPVFIYAVSSLLQASRGDFVVLMISGFIMWCVLKRRNQPNFHLSGKQVITLIGLVAAALASFVSLSSVVGRKLSKTPFDNLMMYVGGSISNFDAFIKDPVVDSNASRLWGGETFYAIYSFMGRRTNRPEWLYSFQLEFRFNGENESMGNIYTAFRYYYHDFGFWGMLLITAFQAALFSMMYYYVTERLSSSSYVISTFMQVLYSYLAVSVAYFPISDWLLRQLLTPTTLFIIMSIAAASYCIVQTTKSPLLDGGISKDYSIKNRGYSIFHVKESA